MFIDRYGTLLSIIVAIASIFYLGLDIKCAAPVDSINVIKTLRSKLYGQDEAIESLKSVFSSQEKIKIIVLVGGIGNGKTFASEIISENINNTHNFQRLVFRNLDDAKMNLGRRILKTCGYNMIVVDDLSVDNVNDPVYLIDHIYSQIDLKTTVLDVILIFNVEDILQDSDEKINTSNVLDIIRNRLQVLNTPIYMIEFKKLDAVSIKKCVINSLSRLSFEISEENINKVMKLIEPTYSGCKEVFAQASLI